MSHIKQFDHVGITVADLDSATAFFTDLGLEVEGRTFLEGDFVDESSASRTRGPRSSCFGRPAEEPGSSSRPSSGPSTSPGRPPRWPTSWDCAASVSWSTDLTGGRRRPSCSENGHGLVGGVGKHENTWRMAQVRGTERVQICSRSPSGSTDAPLPLDVPRPGIILST